VLIKLRTCPDVTAKYSGELAGTNAAALFAVTTAVLPIVAQMPPEKLWTTRTWYV
jgi:hypothetical protein